MARILLIDEDNPSRQELAEQLRSEGFAVACTDDRRLAAQLIERLQVDLIVLDVTTSQWNGWQLARGLRQQAELPMLLLGHGGDPTIVVKGFQLGAEDYLAKPVHAEELIVRVRALLKRHRMPNVIRIQLGDLMIDKATHEVRVREQRLFLPLKEFQLLFMLASNPNRILSRAQLIEHVWGAQYEGGERTVDVHVKRLRARLGAITASIRFLSVRGVGYRLEVEEPSALGDA
ncbi:response regulator transcription factor [Paenibacillus whitsoniae]|uniref:response regulator transcription factor n=1 Tax=Paenibacillus whitsoniae TaxID=2496558 RepID=UPI0013E0C874|nr:response regulator transcription factor [Paenibacillus whitsoniae]